MNNGNDEGKWVKCMSYIRGRNKRRVEEWWEELLDGRNKGTEDKRRGRL